MAGQPVPHGAVPPSTHTPTSHPEHHGTRGSSSSSRGPYSNKRSDSIDSNSSGRGRRTQTDDKNLSEEMVSRIYQEELAKLARQAQKSGNPAEYSMYQQELQRIAVEANKKGHKPQVTISRNSVCILRGEHFSWMKPERYRLIVTLAFHVVADKRSHFSSN